MHRIDHATREIDGNGAGKDGFTEGAPGVVPATVVTADWANAVQEEIAAVIEDRGIALDKPDNAQLLEAINKPYKAGERGVIVGGLQGRPGWDAVNDRPHWVPDSTAGAAWDIIRAHTGRGTQSFSFTAGVNIPFKAVITEVNAWVQQGYDHAEGNRMLMRIATRNAVSFNAEVVATLSASGGTSIQGIEQDGLTIPLEATELGPSYPTDVPLEMIVTIFAGTDDAGGPPVNDLLYLLEVRYIAVIV